MMIFRRTKSETLSPVTFNMRQSVVLSAEAIGARRLPEIIGTLDVRHLEPWQLDEAQAIDRDLQDRIFASLHSCVVDTARVELDGRTIRDPLALPTEAQDTLMRLRMLLTTDPSRHGAKQPELT